MAVHLQRKRVFSIAHRYGIPARSAEWNRQRFGDQTEIHGHNYTLAADFEGDVEPASGIVVNLTDVKEWLNKAVRPFDNRFADAQSPAMAGRQPSTECLALTLWERILPHTQGTPARLTSVSIAESETLRSEYRGEGALVYVTRTYDFSASHRLHAPGLDDARNAEVFGKCNNPHGHGHNYGVEVTVRGDIDPETGFAFPLDRLDEVVESRVIALLDHRDLNRDVPQFARLNPTSENLAIVIWDLLRPELGEGLHKVRVEETARNAFEYFG